MNTEINSPPAPSTFSATRPFYWSIRRELQEYRSIYLAPLAIAGVVLLGSVVVLARLPQMMRTALSLDPSQQRDAFVHPFEITAALIMMASAIVSVYYALDTLYGERRDRSILFWKSLPVSDLTTVLAKAVVLLLVLPAISYVITALTEGIIVLLSSAVLAASGLSVAKFWALLMPYQTMSGLAYHLVTVHILWYAPLYTWMMLISAWSKRAPFLWAALPPFAVVIFERTAFHTSYFLNFLQNRATGVNDGSDNMADPRNMNMAVHFVATPGLWYGLIFAAAFLAIAARLRRYRGPV